MKISFCAMKLFLAALVGVCLTTTTTSAFLLMRATPVKHQQSNTNLFSFQQTSGEDNVNSNKRSNTRLLSTLRSQQQQIMSQAALTVALVVSMTFFTAAPAHADGATKTFKLPPIDNTDKSRCILKSSNMGQANAARDKLVDLRECQIPNANARGFDLSGVLMTNTDLSKANFQDAYFSKGYMHDSNMDGADFSNGIIDRASFRGSSVKGALFKNAVLTSTSFDGANVQDADFSDAAMGTFDIQRLCKNPTLTGTNPITGADTRESVGCP